MGVSSKFNSPMYIEYTGGPSQDAIDGLAAWGAQMEVQRWQYQHGYFDKGGYFDIKNQFINAVVNQQFDQAAQILTKNPNFVIELNGKMTAGQDAADSFMTALANLPQGDPSDSASNGGSDRKFAHAPQNSADGEPQGWHAGVSWTKCPPVQFLITGIGPKQAPDKTAISQQQRADIPDGGVAIKLWNFGVTGLGKTRNVFLNMKFEVDWSTATPASVPSGIPTQGPFFPVDKVGGPKQNNAPGNQIDVYNYQKYDEALASTRTAMVTTWIPSNTAGVKCPE